ncbi:hypothetical protein D3C80_2120510 [compost metagenome]
MADYDDPDVSACANVKKGVPNLGLSDRIKHGRHFVSNDIPCGRIQRSDYAETLLLTAGQLDRPAA